MKKYSPLPQAWFSVGGGCLSDVLSWLLMYHIPMRANYLGKFLGFVLQVLA